MSILAVFSLYIEKKKVDVSRLICHEIKIGRPRKQSDCNVKWPLEGRVTQP